MSSLHEYECKLLCLILEATQAARKLLEVCSIKSKIAKNKNIKDPKIALRVILSINYKRNKLRKLKTLLYAGYELHLFEPNSKTIKDEIAFERLDFFLVNDLLSNLNGLQKYDNAMCSKVHSPSLANTTCNYGCIQCLNCDSIHTIESCHNYKIKNALYILREACIFSAHLTGEECKELETCEYKNKVFLELKCKTWVELLKYITEAIKDILKYLERCFFITEDEYNSRLLNIEIIVYRGNRCYWKLYTEHSSIVRSNILIREMTTNVYNKTLIATLAAKRTGCFSIKCMGLKYQTFESYDLDSPPMQKFFKHYNNKLTPVLGNIFNDNLEDFTLLSVNFEAMPISKKKFGYGLKVSTKIQFTNALPKCFYQMYSSELIEMRKMLKRILYNLLRKEINYDIRITCIQCKFAPMELIFNLYKVNKKAWTEKGRNHIDAVKLLIQDHQNNSSMNKFKERFGSIHRVKLVVSTHSVSETPDITVDIQTNDMKADKKIDFLWPTVCYEMIAPIDITNFLSELLTDTEKQEEKRDSIDGKILDDIRFIENYTTQELFRLIYTNNSNNHHTFLSLVRENPKRLHEIDDLGCSLYHVTAFKGYEHVLEEILKLDASEIINKVDSWNMTALMKAAWNGRYDCVKILLKYGASIDIKNSDGKSAYDLAGMYGNYKAEIQLIIEKKRNEGKKLKFVGISE